jgi:hypothetical protein
MWYREIAADKIFFVYLFEMLITNIRIGIDTGSFGVFSSVQPTDPSWYGRRFRASIPHRSTHRRG